MGETPIFDQLVAGWTSPTGPALATPHPGPGQHDGRPNGRGDQARHRSRILTFDTSRRPGTTPTGDSA